MRDFGLKLRQFVGARLRLVLDVDLVLDFPRFVEERGDLRFLVRVPLCERLLLCVEFRRLRGFELRDLVALAFELAVEATDFLIDSVVPLLVQQRDFQRLQDDMQADVEKDRQDILGRMSQKMQDVINKLAEDKGLDLILESSQTLYTKPVLDLTADATAAYNKANPAK